MRAVGVLSGLVLGMAVNVQGQAAPSEDTFTFFSIGDWGSGSENQTRLAKVMGQWAEHTPPKFVLSLGDNFYPMGVQNTSDPLWETRFEKMYNASSLAGVPWVSMLGNHDYYGGYPEAQIDYCNTKRGSGRWYMPSNYYSRTFPFKEGGSGASNVLQLVVLDSVPLDEHNFHRQLLEDMGPVHAQRLLQQRDLEREQEINANGQMEEHPHLRKDAQGNSHPHSMIDKDKAAAQLAWLDATLKDSASAASVVLVAGHYPLYSAGRHGDSAVLQRDVEPILHKYNVSAYLAGHDHTLQHLENKGLHQFVSGGGGAGLYTEVQPSHPKAKWVVAETGFMVHQLNATHMHTTVLDREGKVLYEAHTPLHLRASASPSTSAAVPQA